MNEWCFQGIIKVKLVLALIQYCWFLLRRGLSTQMHTEEAHVMIKGENLSPEIRWDRSLWELSLLAASSQILSLKNCEEHISVV